MKLIKILDFKNYDLTNVITPVKHDVLRQLLVETGYDKGKTQFIVDGFKYGFTLGYDGPKNVRLRAPNLKLRVGDEIELWNKVMKEVKLGRYAGPYDKIPCEFYIQSPIGLVPKDGGKNTRLIFHLLYLKRPHSTSVNANTPEHLCKVQYPDFPDAVRLCMKMAGHSNLPVFLSKMDVSAAFHNLGILGKEWKYLIMKARSPFDGKWKFFVEKCLSFGASISCKNFQEFSNAIAHIVRVKTNWDLINFLDDYLFAELFAQICNRQMEAFMSICREICLPISPEKTVFATTLIVFLGFMIDTLNRRVMVPCEKLARGLNMINFVLEKCKIKAASRRKITIGQLQKICGFLNFLGRAIVPGRAFTRQLYAHLENFNLLPHHHMRITDKICLDLVMWSKFLTHQTAYCREFTDFSKKIKLKNIYFAMDASKNDSLGFGGHCGKFWMQQAWLGAVTRLNPSIQFLELYALVARVLAWIQMFKNQSVIVYTDNKSRSIHSMVNKTTSGCKRCMVLVRILVMHCLKLNVRLRARYIETKHNKIANSLSRFQKFYFNKLALKAGLYETPTPVPKILWPVNKIWLQ